MFIHIHFLAFMWETGLADARTSDVFELIHVKKKLFLKVTDSLIGFILKQLFPSMSMPIVKNIYSTIRIYFGE